MNSMNHLIKDINYIDEYSKDRKLFYFTYLGIPDLLSLGQVELSANTQVGLDEHIHLDSFEICYHYSGRQYYEVNGKGYETKSGDIFLTFPNEPHSTGTYGEEKSKFFYLIFHLMPDTQHFMGLEEPVSAYIRDTLFSAKQRHFRGVAAMKTLLETVCSFYFSNHPFRKEKIFSCLIEFFYQLTDLIQNKNTDLEVPPDIQLAMDYMETHTFQNISITQLAEMACLSDSQFKKKFRHFAGLSPHDYLLRCRVSLAEDMLKYTQLSMSDIALELGFSSSQHFAVTFKKYTGKTPTECRRALRAKD